jgi:hypothetical protein
MKTTEEMKREPARYRRFGIQSLLMLMLVVAAYLGGRISMAPELSRIKNDLALTREKLEDARFQRLFTPRRTNNSWADQHYNKSILKYQLPTEASNNLAEKLNVEERFERFLQENSLQGRSK